MRSEAELAHAGFVEPEEMTDLVAHGLDDLGVQKGLVPAEVTRERVAVDDDLVGRVVGFAPGKPLGDLAQALCTRDEHPVCVMGGAVVRDGGRDGGLLREGRAEGGGVGETRAGDDARPVPVVEDVRLEHRGDVLPVGAPRIGGGEQPLYCLTVRDLAPALAAEQARQSLEVQLRQSQKMEALGKLTGGIAHDFNNLLTVVMGNLEMLEDRLADPEAAALMGAELTERLLAFGRRQPLRLQEVEIDQAVPEIVALLRRTLGLLYLSTKMPMRLTLFPHQAEFHYGIQSEY